VVSPKERDGASGQFSVIPATAGIHIRHRSRPSAGTTGSDSGETEVPSNTVGELVMEALSTLDPVAYIRFASVYRNFREAKGFWRVPRADCGG